MSYFDSVTGKNKLQTVVIRLKDALRVDDLVQKLGVHEVIREIETGLLDKTNPDIYFAKKQDSDQRILELSLKYQVLSKKTAFICKIKENVVQPG